MILTFLGRKSDDMCSKESCYIWELMAMALNDMVLEVDVTSLIYTNLCVLSAYSINFLLIFMCIRES